MTEEDSATLEKTRVVRASRWNGPPLLLAAEGARAVVAGTGAHRPSSRLPQVPAVPATVTDVGQCLVERAGLAPAGLTVLVDPATPADLGEALERAAREATSVLLFHFVGHGLFSAGNELHLATHATVDLGQGPPGHQALPWTMVRRILSGSRAGLVVVVLDCCFTGGARPVPAKAMEQPLDASWRGAYVLASAGRDENSWALPGVRHTALSGALLRLLNEGDPDGPAAFTLDHVHHHLARALPGAGFPRPRRQAGELKELPPLAANPAHQAPRTRPGPPLSSPGDLNSPYRGLAAYGAGQAALFFGRDEPARSLATRVRQALRAAGPPAAIGGQEPGTGGPLVLTGPSGCGKTSLLQAGLIPALGDDVGGTVTLTPGAWPMARLARELAALTGGDPERLRAVIESDPGAVRRGLPRRTLVLVDQFEELFTLCADETARRRFVAALAELSRSAAVVIAVRGDFFGRCAAFPGLLETMRRPEVVPPLSAAELRQVIEEPAVRSGLSLEPGLADLILDDLRALEGSDDLLALLSHALLATWQRRTGGVLTMAGYRAAGGVARAVALSGEETLRRLGAASEPVARALLVPLVHVDERAGGMRRRVPVAELSPGPASVEGQVLAEFARARLVTVDGEEAELAHDALIRAWPRLANWAETTRAALLVRRRLAEDAELWQRDGQNASYLYTDDRLATAQAAVPALPATARAATTTQAATTTRAAVTAPPVTAHAAVTAPPAASKSAPGITPVEREFLDASLRRRSRRRTITRGVIASLSVLFLAAAAGAVVALVQSSGSARLAGEAARQRDEALSRRLATAANAAGDTSLGAQLALTAYRLSATPEARGALLGSLSRPVGARMIGHTGPVERVAYRADGRVAVTASGDFTARLWNVADPLRPAALGVVRGHTGPVLAAAFTANGKILATGSADGTARLWEVSDTAGPRALATLKGHAEQLGSVSFSPKGDVLATASTDGSMRLWNVADPARPAQVAAVEQDSDVTRAAFSPDGRLVALATTGGAIHLLDVRTPAKPARLATLTSAEGAVRSVAFAPDGSSLASSSATGAVQLWDITATKLVGTARGHSGPVDDVAFSPDGAVLASASADGTAGLWSVENPGAPERTATLAGFPDGVTGVAFSPDGQNLATAATDGVARLWNVSNASRTSPYARLARHTGQVNGLALAGDGRTLATASADRTVRLWDVSDPAVATPQSTLSGHTGPVLAAAFSADGRRLVTASADKTARLWDVSETATPKLLGTLTGHTDDVLSATFSQDGKLVLTAGRDGRRMVWNVATPARPTRVSAPGAADGQASVAAFRPDGRLMAAAVGSGAVRLWDISTPAEPRGLITFAAHPGRVLDLRFSRDGRTLATASSDGTVRLWNVADTARPTRLSELAGHSADVTGLAFGADGRTLVTSSADTTVRIWNVVTPSSPALWAVLGGRSAAADVELGPDGTMLAAASGAGAQLWGLNVEQATANVCETSGTPITRAEWARHVPGRPYAPPCAAATAPAAPSAD
ncbi:caspase, EACC1-associated type [Nonomuraea candida]|uniref:caspase, EACC1-associated type n=1 Tax=Nonomuraea candida TaxID=359159 RepID=UPI0005B8AF74|nr:caspase family protein [Nonomuraea candida]